MKPGATTKLLASTMVLPLMSSVVTVDVVGRNKCDAIANETDVGDRVVTSCWVHDTTASDGGVEES